MASGAQPHALAIKQLACTFTKFRIVTHTPSFNVILTSFKRSLGMFDFVAVAGSIFSYTKVIQRPEMKLSKLQELIEKSISIETYDVKPNAFIGIENVHYLGELLIERIYGNYAEFEKQCKINDLNKVREAFKKAFLYIRNDLKSHKYTGWTFWHALILLQITSFSYRKVFDEDRNVEVAKKLGEAETWSEKNIANIDLEVLVLGFHFNITRRMFPESTKAMIDIAMLDDVDINDVFHLAIQYIEKIRHS
jgi:hypothetical protein